MKKYEAPELIKADIKIEDVVSTTYTESENGGTGGWLKDWTSAIEDEGEN